MDVTNYRLPDGITAALALLGLVWFAATGATAEAVAWRLVEMLSAGLALWLFRTGFRAIRGRQGLGFGDVKLFAAGAAWMTPEPLIWSLLIACIAGLMLALVHQGRRLGRTMAGPLVLPFGALLAPAFWLVWIAEQARLIR